jgi:hypothetical protein
MEEAGRATILRLLQIVAGKTPIPHGVELMAQDVVIHMDGHTFYGINTWANWLSYIRTRGRVADLDVEVDRLVSSADGTITAHGRWKARQRGKEVFSREVRARYRVVDGVVAEIWTTRTNYAFMVGPMMGSRAGHLLVMLHVFFWAKRSGVPDLRTSPALATGSAQPLNTCEERAVT